MIVVAGVGINVRQRSEAFDLPLRQGATSLEAAGGAPLRRGDVMTSIIDALRPLFRRPLQPLMTDELDTWADLDALAGRAITLTGGAPHSHGTARGIAPDGALLLETGSGTVRVSSATVRPAATPPDHPAPYMILVFDIGNTEIVMGLFDEDRAPRPLARRHHARAHRR
jgi:biotin-(acetyl-CoA carboxylase) ligase